MPNIEVDAEVFAYLKSKAEPFLDTPNSVLRRELLGRIAVAPGRVPQSRIAQGENMPGQLAFGMPEALRQILEVVEIVRRGNRTRTEATLDVARRHNIARETVADKYGRQLGLTAAGFDTLLKEHSLRGLRDRLQKTFPAWNTDIIRALQSLPTASA